MAALARHSRTFHALSSESFSLLHHINKSQEILGATYLARRCLIQRSISPLEQNSRYIRDTSFAFMYTWPKFGRFTYGKGSNEDDVPVPPSWWYDLYILTIWTVPEAPHCASSLDSFRKDSSGDPDCLTTMYLGMFSSLPLCLNKPQSPYPPKPRTLTPSHFPEMPCQVSDLFSQAS